MSDDDLCTTQAVQVLVADIDYRRGARYAAWLEDQGIATDFKQTRLETLELLDTSIGTAAMPRVLLTSIWLLDGNCLERLANFYASGKPLPRLVLLSPHGWEDVGDIASFLHARLAIVFDYSTPGLTVVTTVRALAALPLPARRRTWLAGLRLRRRFWRPHVSPTALALVRPHNRRRANNRRRWRQRRNHPGSPGSPGSCPRE